MKCTLRIYLVALIIWPVQASNLRIDVDAEVVYKGHPEAYRCPSIKLTCKKVFLEKAIVEAEAEGNSAKISQLTAKLLKIKSDIRAYILNLPYSQ